jgi:hypothetical protein
MPKMKHKSGGRAIEVAPAAVAMYESQGWEVQPSTPKKSSAQTTTQAPVATEKE